MFLVDRQGIVRWAHADPDYKVRPSVEQVLRTVDSALRRSRAIPLDDQQQRSLESAVAYCLAAIVGPQSNTP
jgi:hypothetical protein